MLSVIAVCSLLSSVQGTLIPGDGDVVPAEGPDFWATPLGGSIYQMPDGNVFTWAADSCPVDSNEPAASSGADDSFLIAEPLPPGSRAMRLIQAPGAHGGTGPYRRVLTMEKYYALTTHVKTPSNSNVSARPTDPAHPGYDDTPYIYSGGWGANRSAGVADSAIDAGLVLNWRTRKWDPFMAFSNRTANQWASWKMSIRPGATVYLAFCTWSESSSSNICDLAWIHVVVQAGTFDVRGNIYQFLPINPNAGWTKTGENCYLKRMTSIAQNAPEGANHGSYVRQVRWSSVAPVEPFTEDRLWRREQSGASTSHAWTEMSGSTSTTVYGYYRYPRIKTTAWPSKVVYVPTFTDAGNEIVKIDCTTP